MLPEVVRRKYRGIGADSNSSPTRWYKLLQDVGVHAVPGIDEKLVTLRLELNPTHPLISRLSVTFHRLVGTLFCSICAFVHYVLTIGAIYI